MRCRNKLFTFFFIGMLCCAAATRAQDVDSTYVIDTGRAAIVTEEATSDVAETQEQPKTISYNKATPTDAQWQQVASQKEFSYKTEKEFTPSAKPPAMPEIPWYIKAIIKIIEFFASATGKILLLLLLALLIGYVLYRILSGDGRIFARNNKKLVSKEEPAVISEEDLLHNNWEEKMRTALATGDQRMVIRYSYMHLLQLLQSRHLIQYRQDKTNTAYYHELSGHAVRNPFRQITRQYEYAWYGNFLPSAPAFEAYLQTFNGVKKELGAS